MKRFLTVIVLLSLTLSVKAQTIQTDSLITEILNAAVISEGNMTYKIDRTTHFFTKEQMAKASEARDLVASIPGLFIDQQSNSIKTVGAKNVLVMINGVKASDYELQLISPDKVKKVDYYDVPPVRYMEDAEVMINVHTSRLDTGWSGNFYGRGGQMYSNARGSLSYVSGNNKITMDIGTHFNHKRKVWDTEEGMYSCILDGLDYQYDYIQKSQDWGSQYSGGLSWLNAKDNNYTLQISMNLQGDKSRMERNRDIDLQWGDVLQKRSGLTQDMVKTLMPVAEVYFSKIVSPSSTLTLDVLGTTYRNSQNAVSSETVLQDPEGGYQDIINLDTRKSSVIGELNYLWSKGTHKLDFGYKGSYNWLQNNLANSDGGGDSNINTSTHRIYGEYSSRINSFSYRFSLGATGNIKSGDNGFSDIAFTPTLLLGYGFKQKHYMRLKLDSETMMPGIQQMSDNRIMIMEGFYKTGNVNVRNSTRYGSQFMYAFNIPGKLAMTADLHFNYIKGKLYNAFVDGGDHWMLQTMNGQYGSALGTNVTLSYVPWKFLEISLDGTADYQTFKANAESDAVHHWFFPVYGNIAAYWKGFTLSYRHTLVGQSLSGIYLEGYEKISYINLSWKKNRLTIGLQCLFPFIDDAFESETTSVSPVLHKTSTNLRTKNHEFGVSLSWNFVKGKGKYSNKSINNSDSDTGVFEF